MVVDFEFKRAPAYRLATVGWKGPWKEATVRSKFASIAHWAKQHKIRTGKWVFWQVKEGQWRVGIEVKNKVKGGAEVRMQTLPKGRVATVVFNPEELSP